MLAEIGDAPFNRATGCGSRSSTAIACSRSSTEGEVRAALAPRARAAPHFPELVAELAQAGRRRHDPRRRDRRVRRARQAVVRRAAEPRAAEDRARDRRRASAIAGGASLLRPAVFRRHRSAQRALRDRRRYLAQCLLPSPLVQLVHAAEDGVALHAAALASGFEGVIGKRKDSRYEAGQRSASWLKVKPTQTADFVIGGYTQGKGARAPLGALLRRLLGRGQDAALRVARRLGLRRAHARAGARARSRSSSARRCPFAREARAQRARRRGSSPKLVAEVSFQRAGPTTGALRAPVFLRLRDDIDAEAVARRPIRPPRRAPAARRAAMSSRHAGGDDRRGRRAAREPPRRLHARGRPAHRIKLTHLDRVYWPADPRCSSRRSPSATCCATSRRCRRTCCRISPTGR